ncbi:MAG: MFS transporter [Alphaproteobacteria bacterium]|nr:MFS transporter [Alphaproteobacteria bacterium]
MNETDADHDSRAAWAAAFAALAILTIAHGAPMISAVALKPIAADLGTSRAAPSAAGALTYAGAAAGGIVSGLLTRRWSIRAIVMFGGVMLGSGLLLSASGGLLELQIGHGVFVGLLGASCMLAPLVTYVSFLFVRRRGAAIALVSSGQSLAGAIWPVLLATGVEQAGWRTTMVAYAAAAVVAIVALAVLFLRPPPAGRGASAAPAADRDMRSVAGLSPNAAMTVLMLAVFCCCVPMNMPLQHIVAFCGDIGLPGREGAAMLSTLLAGALIARQFWGWIADRIGGLGAIAWSSAAQAVALAGLLATQDEAALFAICAAFGFGLSGLLPAYVIAIREHFPPREAAWRVPVVLFAGYIGMAAGGWGAGAVFDALGHYLPAFALGLAFNVANVVLIAWVVRRHGAQSGRERAAGRRPRVA